MSKSNEIIQKFDVVICGGGVSGSIAAIAAARNGAKVLVVEQYANLGGSLTSNGVGPMMTFFAGEKQVIKGLPEEIVQCMVKKGYSPGHIKDTTKYISYITPFDAEGLKIVLDEMLLEAGCKVLFHTFIGEVQTDNGVITAITICNKNGLSKIYGKVFIDATGDGDIAAWSGAAMTKGRESDGASQPMTMNMKVNHVDANKLRQHIAKNAEKFPRMVNNIELMNNTKYLSLAGFIDEFKTAKANEEVHIPREDILMFETAVNGEFILNTTRIIDHDSTDAWSLSEAEIEGRKQCEELIKFLRKYIPGFENCHLESTGPNIGSRGSRQLKGIYTLTAQDILEQKLFKSVVAHSGYPIDIHNPKGEGTNSSFMSAPDAYYNIPYEIMVCNEIKNLLVTGRCVSATFEAQASLRVTPSVGALGQACGIAAALAAKNDCDTRKIDINELQTVLKEQGAYIETNK